MGKLNGLRRGRVIDMEAFNRCTAAKMGAGKIAKALGVPLVQAQHLMRGEHWQQNPAKVRWYNEVNKTKIDPQTGIPAREDLEAYGGIYEPGKGPSRHESLPVQQARAALREAGINDVAAKDVVERLQALNGFEAVIPARLDTQVFLNLIEDRLYRVLSAMDAPTIAKMTPSELTKAFSALSERRSLMRGEPTAIVRNENRGALEEVGKRLLLEMARRGIAIEGTVEVTN